MLEEIVKHVELMSKEAVVEQIRKELIEKVLSGSLPKRWPVIEEKLQALSRQPEGRAFQFHAVNFVLWINGMPSAAVHVPQPQTFTDPATLIKYLPYQKFVMRMGDKLLQIFPGGTGEPGQPLTRELAEAILRKVDDKEYRKEIFLTQGRRLMWVNEDGLASVRVSTSGYQVKSLKEFLEGA